MTAFEVEAVCWDAPSNIKAFTTTRHGGVSQAPFGSMNLGMHVGDSPASVIENRARLVAQHGLPYEPFWLNQVHSSEVIRLDRPSNPSVKPSADGAFTNAPKLVCAVLTADCLPLLLSNRQGSCVAALHIGWRGMAAGIIEEGVRVMGEDPNSVIAWAGPCIGPTAFEVGADVRDQLGGSDATYRSATSPGKLLANLYLMVGERLAAMGVEQYSHSDACTYNEPARYFSYRRDGECGRMASVIWIE